MQLVEKAIKIAIPSSPRNMNISVSSIHSKNEEEHSTSMNESTAYIPGKVKNVIKQDLAKTSFMPQPLQGKII